MVSQGLVDGFKRARSNQEVSLGFEFENLSITLKNGLNILQGVSGSIRPVCFPLPCASITLPPSLTSLPLCPLLKEMRRARERSLPTNYSHFLPLSLSLSPFPHSFPHISSQKGRVTAIMGPSGAGKTTFMNCLMGKVPRTGGSLRINNKDLEMHTMRKVIGYVPQVRFLCCLSFFPFFFLIHNYRMM